MHGFPQILLKQCIDSFTGNHHQSSLMTHKNCVVMSLSTNKLPSACILFFIFVVFCLVWYVLGINYWAVVNSAQRSRPVMYKRFSSVCLFEEGWGMCNAGR